MVEKIIDIDFNKLGELLNNATEPKVMVMADSTLFALLAEDPDAFEEHENELGTSFSLNEVPVSLTPELDFGYVIVK